MLILSDFGPLKHVKGGVFLAEIVKSVKKFFQKLHF